MIDRWLFAPATRHRAAAVRIGLAAVIGLRCLVGPYHAVGGQPAALFRPPPILTWLPGMPAGWVLGLLQLVGVVAALAVVTGRRPVLAFAIAWMALLFLAGCKDSLGKILHNDVLLLLSCIPVLALGPARLGDRTLSRRAGGVVRAATIVIAIAYFSAAAEKLHISGLSWVTSDNMRWVMYQAAASGRMISRTLPLAIANRPWLAHAVAGGILLTELSAPLIIFSRRFRPVFIVLALFLHGGTWFTLGLDYWGWILTVFVVLVDWDRHGSSPPADAVPVEAAVNG